MMGLEEFGTTENQPEVTPGQCSDQPVCEGRSKKSDKDLGRLVQWANWSAGRYIACSHTLPTLASGVYTLLEDANSNPLFCELPLDLDDSYYFPDSIGDRIIKEIENFWDSEENYVRHGYCHRRGYLLYGPVGSGKSVIVQQAIERIIKRGGIVVLCEHPGLLLKAMHTFRQVEPVRKVLCIFEDIDAIVHRYGDSGLLSFLDGEGQISRVLNLATTNYPERLDKRIVSRPRRFDRVIKVGMPVEEVRQAYFVSKLGKVNGDGGLIEKLVRVTEGFSFAAMAETIISIKCLGNDIDGTIRTLKEMQQHLPSSDEYNGKGVGFGASR